MSEILFGMSRPVKGAPDRRAPRFAMLLAVLASLGACGGSAPLESFDLSAPTQFGGGRSPRGQLVITEPVATAPTDSDRIVVRPTPDTVATLKGAQWVERLPRLLQTRLVQAFENARLLRAVGRPEAKIQADVSMSSEIRRFEMDVAAGEAVVEMSVKLIAERSGRIIAAQIFTARTPGTASDGTAAAAALDQALGMVMGQIVAWSASRI